MTTEALTVYCQKDRHEMLTLSQKICSEFILCSIIVTTLNSLNQMSGEVCKKKKKRSPSKFEQSVSKYSVCFKSFCTCNFIFTYILLLVLICMCTAQLPLGKKVLCVNPISPNGTTLCEVWCSPRACVGFLTVFHFSLGEVETLNCQ